MKSKAKETKPKEEIVGPVSLRRFREMLGVTAVTTWRWRQKGWLKTVNIRGRPYLTSKGLAEFETRAEKGDFAQNHFTPKKTCRAT